MAMASEKPEEAFLQKVRIQKLRNTATGNYSKNQIFLFVAVNLS